MERRPQFPKPKVRLRNYFKNPTLDAVSAARTCYSPRIISLREISEQDRVRIGRTTYEGGHHTVYQHEMFEFELSNVSRAFVHDFLHTHPFYNSSQQSQRYVKLDTPQAVLPPIDDRDSLKLYKQTLLESYAKYDEITEILYTALSSQYSSQEISKKTRREVMEKAMEAARYDLCIGAHTVLIHTIDGVTLWRLYRLRKSGWEANEVVSRMADAVKKIDPYFFDMVDTDKPLERDFLFENRILSSVKEVRDSEKFIGEFDSMLEGRRSKLISWGQNAMEVLAGAVRHVLGLSRQGLSNEDAVDLVVNPARNSYLAESLNLSITSPLMRTMNHISYTFSKKLSHTADSQDQRHRTVPGSRPIMVSVDSRKPDYITPIIIERNKEADAIHRKWMDELWKRKNDMIDNGVPAEFASYILPNALAVRFEETGSLLNLYYKYTNRSCLRTQEEEWIVTMEEIEQIREVHPQIGKYLGPPCFVRKNAANEFLPEELGKVRYCNQGKLYCRQPVWNFYPKVTVENILKV